MQIFPLFCLLFCSTVQILKQAKARQWHIHLLLSMSKGETLQLFCHWTLCWISVHAKQETGYTPVRKYVNRWLPMRIRTRSTFCKDSLSDPYVSTNVSISPFNFSSTLLFEEELIIILIPATYLWHGAKFPPNWQEYLLILLTFETK